MHLSRYLSNLSARLPLFLRFKLRTRSQHPQRPHNTSSPFLLPRMSLAAYRKRRFQLITCMLYGYFQHPSWKSDVILYIPGIVWTLLDAMLRLWKLLENLEELRTTCHLASTVINLSAQLETIRYRCWIDSSTTSVPEPKSQDYQSDNRDTNTLIQHVFEESICCLVKSISTVCFIAFRNISSQ